MPSTELGLAEIGERLRSLCRRSNRIVVIRVAAAVLTVACLSVALRFGLGREGFQGAPAWLAGAACLATTGWAILHGRTHWIDLTHAARLADQQGNLHDRLTTLLALAESNRTNRLLPVLLSQSLELGERWQPQRLIPQSYPKSVYVAAAALLVMATSPLFEPNAPLPPEMPTAPSPPSMVAEEEETRASHEPAALAAASLDTGTTHEKDVGDDRGDVRANQGQGNGEGESTSANQSKTVQGKLTGHMPALGAKPSAQLSNQPRNSKLQGSRTDAEAQQAAEHQEHHGARGDGKVDDRKGQGKTNAANQNLAQQAPPRGKQGEDLRPQQAQQGAAPSAASAQLPNPSQDENKRANEDPKPQGQGSSPGAGTGSEAATILTVRGGDASADAAGLSTFKLTLNSFLDRVDKKSQRHRDDKHPPVAGANAEGAAPARPEKELDDDALRRTTIPAEYEDVVKRVYTRH